jgi:hypothetical protein
VSKLNGKWIEKNSNNLTHAGAELGLKFSDADAAHADKVFSSEKVDTISGVLSTEIDTDIATHSASGDHDGRYYTETEIDTWRNLTTQTEMGYVHGVTSDIQTQLDAKDNYQSWSFAVDGVTKDAITSSGVLDFVAGDNITVTRSAENQITFSGSAGGEINTMTNLGGGEGVYYQKDGVQFQMKSLVGGANITLTSSNNEITISGSSGGSTDHGALTGLLDDDHSQYHNDTRGDARYYQKSEVDTISGALSTEIDSDITTHSASDDHDGRYYTETEVDNTITTVSGDLQTQIDAIDIQPNEAEYFTLTSGNVSDKYVSLANSPYAATEVLLDVIHGCTQRYDTDYTVSGVQVQWTGLGLDGVLEVDDELRVVYSY